MILSAINARKREKAIRNTPLLDYPTKHPIILCHGLFGFDTVSNIIHYWTEIPSALQAAGCEVWAARVPATSSVETRAKALVRQITEKYRGRSVHLVGHSMGGLDCRYLTTHLLDGAGFKVLSVTTIATPHLGTPTVDLLAKTRVTETPLVRFLMNMVPFGDGDGQGIVSLSTKACSEFNKNTPDVPGVRYFSYGCSFSPGPVDALTWGLSHLYLHVKHGENDGAVSVQSAQWGEYLGTIPNVTHTEIIGHKLTQFTRLGDVLNRLGGQAPFDPKQFMIKHARKLATEVETTVAGV
ncbi:hypothetical protein FRC07_007916 [Ceratobasidium sp. 392]|nr:hypothetical protein FRC07_007916 [Ceratobasidium sp. 392]